MAITDDRVDTIAEIKALQNALHAEIRRANGDIFAPEVQRILRRLAKVTNDYQNERLTRIQ